MSELVFEKIKQDLINTINDATTAKTSPYDTKAVVKRVDGDTVYVHIEGGVSETPITKTIDAKKGDVVQVRVSGGRAWLTGNESSPPTDDTTAVIARDKATVANNKAIVAQGTADKANGTAVNAKETAEAILIYDHDYTLETIDEHIIANFQAHLFRGGVDIHTAYDQNLFTWYIKTEDGTEYLGNGYTISVDTTNCGYGAEIIGKFTTTDDAEALTQDGSNLTNVDGENLTVRSTGDSVRVRDLTVTTAIYPQEKLMVVGAEDEHLVTMQSLQDYLNLHLDKQVMFGTKAEWDAQVGLVSEPNKLYVYTDYKTDGSGRNLAGIKVGDGNAFLIDKPFIDELYFDHVQDNSIHVTAGDKLRWDEAVNCYYSSGDMLTFVHV